MEAQRKPKTKPRTRVPDTSTADLGPAPVPPSHRSFGNPLTDREVQQRIAQAPVVVSTVPGAPETSEAEEPEYSEVPERVESSEQTPSPCVSASASTSEVATEAKEETSDRERPVSVPRSPQVTELPASMLLPRELPPPAPPREIYPKIEEAPPLPEKTAIHNIVVPATAAITEKIRYPDINGLKEESRSALPAFAQEGELLSEGQLLQYYQNEQLEFLDDFVGVFLEQEINPHHCLFDLLSHYKDVCERLQSTMECKKSTMEDVMRANNEVWAVEDKEVTQSGRCGDDRAASGKASYKLANFIAEKVVELKVKLDELSLRELDEGLCLEIRARSLALQIQWTIITVNTEFLSEMRTNATAPPILLGANHANPKRTQLRGAISDLFFFLRHPMLPSRFSESCRTWIAELTSVLYKSCTTDDQMYILCQLLRTPTPITPWGNALVQTFISVPSLDSSRAIDAFVALLALVVQPVKARDEFLSKLAKFYDADNSWNVVSDDGDMDNAGLIGISETDLLAILGQFDIRALMSTVIQRFIVINKHNKTQTMLSLISFGLNVAKICNEGMETYSAFKNVCKKLANFIRLMVQNLCYFWDLSKPEIISQSDVRMIQNEVNRIVLISMYHIVSKKSVGLWQFLVDFPYSSVSETCRQRCQLLLRNPTRYAELYEISDDAVSETLRKSGALVDRMNHVGQEDITYMVSTLASVVSQSETDLGYFMDEMIRVCFLEESTRDKYYKVGSEAVAIMIQRCPKLLSSILHFIDRNVDHLDQYAIDILTNAPLSSCVLSKDDVESRLGKWLINRPLDHPASHIARRVLTSVNWGSIGALWMPQVIHDACADAIVKAHIAKCKTRNSLISKSYAKAAKMATKCPDMEQQFDKFCWDVLIRLKFVTEALAPTPQNDLVAFFVFLMRKCLISVDIFLEHGLKHFTELVNSSCFYAAVVFLARLVASFPLKVPVLIQNETFQSCVDRLLHADESSYAMQLLMGADKFPGPVLRMFISAITYSLANPGTTSAKDLTIAWLQLLCCKKVIDWNQDKPVLSLIGVLVGMAFERDPEHLYNLVETVTDMYRNMLAVWKESNRGPLSWFSSHIPPPLIQSSLLNVSPWTSILLLLAEPKVNAGFYSTLYASMQKHPNRALDEFVKKAAAKSHTNLSVERLDYYRWLELCLAVESEHPAFPLICQQFCTVMLERRLRDKIDAVVPGDYYRKSPASTGMLTQLRNEIFPKAEKSASEKLASYFRAIPQWLFTDGLYNAKFNQYHSLNLDYLVQMITSGDKHFWLDFVPMDRVRKKVDKEAKIFISVCHLDNQLPGQSRESALRFTNLTDFFHSLSSGFVEAADFPMIPPHEGLPMSENLSLSDCCNSQFVLRKFVIQLDEVSKIAKLFVDGKERVNDMNVKYLELFGRLYNSVQTTLIINMKCGNFLSSKCTRPTVAQVTVNASQYSTDVAQKMNDNRQKREEEVGRLLAFLDSTAIKSAHFEFVSRRVCLFGEATRMHPVHFDKVRQTGQALFYHLCQSIDHRDLLFPAGTDAYTLCIKSLGSSFIAHQPNEQLRLMKIVLADNPLNHFLYQHFTPHCVTADQLFHLYTELSRCVRSKSTATASLNLLQKLDIEQAGIHMPPNQFSSLMPIIFENLVSAAGTNTVLTELCSRHFVHALFHHFPHNFPHGLTLLLSAVDSQAIPVSIFEKIGQQLHIDVVLNNDGRVPPKMPLDAVQATQCIQIIASQLAKSKKDLMMRLFSVWQPYLDYVCRFAEFFIRSYVALAFNSDSPTAVISTELQHCFSYCVNIWGSLLQPVNRSIAPWTPADNVVAAVVVERFIKLLQWLPHSVYLPPGDGIETHFWNYFATELMCLQRAGSSHIYPIYEEKIIALNWSRFWPNVLVLTTMKDLIVNGPPEVGPIVTEILIRIPWQQLIQQQAYQPVDNPPLFYSLLLPILARIAHRAANFAKSRASVERLLTSLQHSCPWFFVIGDTADTVGAFIASSYPNETLTAPSDVVKAFFGIWRLVCFFTTTNTTLPENLGDVEVIRKQSAYLRTDMKLMLKANWSQTEMQKHYREMLTKVDLVIGGRDLNEYAPLVRELTSFYPSIPKDKTTLLLIKVFGQWLRDHAESGIILLALNTVMESMSNAEPKLALKLVNKVVRAYFFRRSSCDWLELCRWIRIPDRYKPWLYTTPSSESGVKPRFLVLNAHLMQQMTQLKSVQEESALLVQLLDYLSCIKPKYISAKNEPAFVLCVEKLQRMIVRQYTNKVSTALANEKLERYLAFLRKIFSDEKGVSFLAMMTKFGRKPAYPLKLQLFAQVLSLFITQQQSTPSQAPRTEGSQGVVNSRQQAFRDLQSNKQFLEHSAALTQVQMFFQQVDLYTFAQAGQLLARFAQLLYPNERSLTRMDM